MTKSAEEVLARIVQRIDENPNEECPFCDMDHHDNGADHDPDCIIWAAHEALPYGRPTTADVVRGIVAYLRARASHLDETHDALNEEDAKATARAVAHRADGLRLAAEHIERTWGDL